MARSEDGYEKSRRRSNSVESDRRTKRKSYHDEDDPRERRRGTEHDIRERKRRRYSSDEDERPRVRRDDRTDDYKPRRDDREDDYKPRRRDASRGRDRRDRRRRSPSSEHDRDTRQRRRDRSADHNPYRSPPRQRSRRSPSPPSRRARGPLPSQNQSFAVVTGDEPPIEKQKPNYNPTGLLAKEANTVRASTSSSRAVVLKYHEPPEARKPPASQQWRMYHFLGASKEPVDTVPLFERSCWLFGRENTIVDVRLDEKTTSKQHAVVQFRYSMSRDEYGDKIERVRPYLIDLESKAGTTLNGSVIEAGRYVELRDGDVVVFGQPEGEREGEEWVVMLPPAE
ncbi:FHA domain-containing protein [Elsinoe fawcettii]|nr:FHA domain-containing protein [Elsinoe fawcettii]